MSYDDKSFMSRGFRVRHKYKRRAGCHSVCERCGVKRRKTSSGWEYFDPRQQPEPLMQPIRPGGAPAKVKLHWTASNPPCVKREEPKQPEPFMAKAELTIDDLNVLTFFFSFATPWADRIFGGFVDPEVAHHPKFYENWQKFADILTRLYKSTGAEEHLASLSARQRKALGRKIARAVAQRAEGHVA